MEQKDIEIFRLILGNIGKIDEIVYKQKLKRNLIENMYAQPDSEFAALGKELQKLGKNLSCLSESALSALNGVAQEATCLKDINLGGKLYDRDGFAKAIANYTIDDLFCVIKKVAQTYVKK